MRHAVLFALASGPCLLLPACGPYEGREPLPPGVSTGADFLQKSTLLRCESIGEVTDIRLGRIDGDEAEYMIVAGLRGFALVDPGTGGVHRAVPFEPTMSSPPAAPVRIEDSDGDGYLEFVRVGEHWSGRTSIHAPNGKTIWAHPDQVQMRSHPPNFTLYGDLDGDGCLEFLMGYNALDRFDLLDCRGNLVWSHPWDSFDGPFELHDIENDGRLEIVSMAGGALWVRDAGGEVLSSIALPGEAFANSVEVVQRYGEPPEERLLVGGYSRRGEHQGQRFYLVEPGCRALGAPVSYDELEPYIGTTELRLAESDAPLYGKVDELKWQAFPAGYSATRLRFRIWDADARLVYEEIIAPESGEICRTDGLLAVLPGGGSGSDRVLVCYGCEVVEYSPAPAPIMTDEHVQIGVYTSPAEADLARIHLEENGVQAHVHDPDPLPGFTSGPTLGVFVRQEDADRARRLLEEK